MTDTVERDPLWVISEAYKSVASTPEGDTMIRDLVRKFGYSRQSTIDVDPLRMAWKEGGRSVCVHIGRMLDLETAEAADTTAKRGVE